MEIGNEEFCHVTTVQRVHAVSLWRFVDLCEQCAVDTQSVTDNGGY